jgi:hypothetical protein
MNHSASFQIEDEEDEDFAKPDICTKSHDQLTWFLRNVAHR